MHKRLLTALLCSGFAVAAYADDVQKPTTNAGETMHFEKLDRSGDKKITRDELPTDHELFLGFEEYDLNGDGEISEHEFGEYVEGLPD